MGLIKAISGSVGGTLADQWKEFFYCESIPKEILMVKGEKRVGSRSTNTKGSDNIISNGSGIAVADGQCMIIVDQGKVVEICSEPGEFTYDTSSVPSLFVGNLGSGIINTIKEMGRRITYGGDTGRDQRVYYFNMKELLGNDFQTSEPIPFRIADPNINLDMDVSVRCSGMFSYKIANPMLFYQNVCGNVTESYSRSEIDDQLKTEFIAALQPAFGKMSSLGLRPNQLVAHINELQDAMNEALSSKWSEFRGLEVVTIAIGTLTLPPEDAEIIRNAQKAAILRDPSMAGATLVSAQAEALKAAAANEGGAMTGLMGVGMVGQMNTMAGTGAQGYYDMANQQKAQQAAQPPAGQWVCACGTSNTGKFCQNCGEKKPEPAAGSGSWTCSCGAVNTGKFCHECGAKKPEAAPRYRCKGCGWDPEDPTSPPKFCPECGNRFGDEDRI